MDLSRPVSITQNQLDAITLVVWLIFAIGLGLVAHRLLYWLFGRWSKGHGNAFATAVVRQTRRSSRYVLPLLAMLVVLPNLNVPPTWTKSIIHLTGLATIVAVAGALIATIRLWGDVVIAPAPHRRRRQPAARASSARASRSSPGSASASSCWSRSARC